MDIPTLIIQLLSGAAGGNIAGALLKNINLGTLGNSVAGILGGGLGGQILKLLAGGAAAAGAAGAAGAVGDATGLDLNTILRNVGGGGIGGAVLMMIVGFIKKAMVKAP